MLHEEGFYNRLGDSAEVSMGYDICDSLDAGYSRSSVTQTVWLRNSNGLTRDDAVLYVDIADDYLC